MAGEELRASLRGTDATLGVIQARDVARLITGLESAVAAAAYATLGKPRRGSTGRHRSSVEAASRLRFQSLEAGSVVAVLRLPQLANTSHDTLVGGIDDLAGAAFDRLIASFGLPDDQVDPAVAKALAELGQDLGIGERHDEVLLTSTRTTARGRLDKRAKERMRRLADAPLGQQAAALIGTLREVDFDRSTARLLTSTGEVVHVDFPAELDDQVYGALRDRATFEGIVSYDPVTAMATRVELRRISTPETPLFDPSAFWRSASIAALAEAQGVGPASLEAPFIKWSDQEIADIASALADLDA